MTLSEYCATERGRMMYLANAVGLNLGYVSQIVNGHRPMPIEHAAAFEAATDGLVSRKEMFPDRWHKIWPELESGDD